VLNCLDPGHFGFLLIPTWQLIPCSNMRQFTLIASLIGGLSALAGFYLSYRWDYLWVRRCGITRVGLRLIFFSRKL